jgi:hypothetical protein
MKHRLMVLSVAAAFAVAGAAVAADQQTQSQQQNQQQTQNPPTQQARPAQETPQGQTPVKVEELTLTGCVIQGSAPTVYVFDNARINATNKEEKPRTYVLITGTDKLDLRPHVNRQVILVGKGEIKTLAPVPPGEKVKEADLPRFTIVRVTEVSTTCTSQ